MAQAPLMSTSAVEDGNPAKSPETSPGQKVSPRPPAASLRSPLGKGSRPRWLKRRKAASAVLLSPVMSRTLTPLNALLKFDLSADVEALARGRVHIEDEQVGDTLRQKSRCRAAISQGHYVVIST